MDRRKFVRLMGMAGVAAAIPWQLKLRDYKFMMARAYPFSQSPTGIRKFIAPLPGLGPTGIPLATKTTQMFAGQLTDVYRLTVKQFKQQLHPDLANQTTLRGYTDNASGISRYLGGVIVANRSRPVLLYITNGLPDSVIVPTDPTLMASETQMVMDLHLNRIATHLHGGLTPWFSDGTPFQWFDPYGGKGSSFMNVPGTNPPVGTQTNYYPNDQGARLVWYHDHAMGITRTNAYTGIASAYIITDLTETLLIKTNILPDLGIPLVIQDKSFFDGSDANYPITGARPGDLWYPYLYEGPGLPNPPGTNTIPDFTTNPFGAGTARWDYGPNSTPPMNPPVSALPAVSCVPEFFADTAMVNGMPYPFLNVTDKRFRFRILNASQARFWHLNLYVEDGTTGELKLDASGKPIPGPALFQIGTEGGFLPGVVKLPNGIPLPLMPGGAYPVSAANPAGPFNLLLAPAERADVIIDFKGWAGTNLILFNDAPAPFPMGDARNEYFTGDIDMTTFGGAPITQIGKGPNTRTIMRIAVGAGPQDRVKTSTIITELNLALKASFIDGEQPHLLYNNGRPYEPGPVPYTGPVHRRLTLNEDFDDFGRLIQRLGTTTQNGSNNQNLPTWSRNYVDPVTENPRAGATEVWEVYNLTGDVHPIHVHLVNFQVIQRAAFDAVTPTFSPNPSTARLPDPNELGWKDTVRMNPGEVTTIIAKFNLPNLPTAAMRNATSPRFPGGREYVWHCHILEHEEHDMMRPLVVY